MKTTGAALAKKLGISAARGMEATIKAKMISAVLKAVAEQGLTHSEVARRSGIPRSAVTGILSGSMQKVTIDRVLRLLEAVGLVADVRVRRAA
ncbi:MAG: XRE family transcriptional regulator [Polyangiaceae bacterium]|nr:XRE family transcriptional regulator [Polyangiaceae bacterium]